MAQKAPGYKFLGWITTAEVEKDSGVWNYIYDVNGDSFTTSDPVKAAPYLVTDDYVCTQPQDVYPVYAKYNVNYDTNLHRAGFTGTDTVNAPNWQITPALTETDGVSTASVEPDIATTVYNWSAPTAQSGTFTVRAMMATRMRQPLRRAARTRSLPTTRPWLWCTT